MLPQIHLHDSTQPWAEPQPSAVVPDIDAGLLSGRLHPRARRPLQCAVSFSKHYAMSIFCSAAAWASGHTTAPEMCDQANTFATGPSSLCSILRCPVVLLCHQQLNGDRMHGAGKSWT